MAQYKTSHTFYSAWNYEKEIEDLNAQSEQGWQLVKGGCFFSRFEKNPNVRYCYQMDFGRIENMGRYIETFREQGWEYINSTFNGWHYFRKPYDETLPESAYEIFTDRESLQEMREHWARIAFGITVALGLFAILSLIRLILRPHLPALVQTLTLATECGLLFFGSSTMRNPDVSHNRKGDSHVLGACLAVILIGAIAGIALTELRPYFHTMQSWSDSDLSTSAAPKDWLSFQVRYPDNYFLDLKIEAQEPLTFEILDKDNHVAYTITEKDFTGEDIRLRLPSGGYRLHLSDYGAGPVKIEVTLN